MQLPHYRYSTSDVPFTQQLLYQLAEHRQNISPTFYIQQYLGNFPSPADDLLILFYYLFHVKYPFIFMHFSVDCSTAL